MFSSKEANIPKAKIAPYCDWRIVVIIFSVGLVLSLGFNSYVFFEINSGSFFVTTPSGEESAKFNKDGLSKVLEELSAKEATFEKLKTENISVVDPSL